MLGAADESDVIITSGGVSAGEADFLPELIEKFKAAFESYWADPDYESYDPTRDAETAPSTTA